MVTLPKVGNFIQGICHPGKRLDLLKEGGFNWTRKDIPFPYEPGQWGVKTEAYKEYCALCAAYAEEGIHMMAITPYPRAFVKFGIDPSTKEGLEQVRQICKEMAQDLAPYHPGYQITNELNVFHFRVPLTMEQVPDYIIAGIQGVHEGDPDALCGYNSAGVGEEVENMIKAIRPYHDMVDYIGLDTYRGTWSDGEPDDIIADIEETYELVGLPVLVQEFGFSSAGEIFDEQEALDYVKKLGYDSMEQVYEDPYGLLMRMPYFVAKRVMESPKEDWATNALHMMPHLLRKWPGGSKRYRHTVEGQAAFYDELMGKMLNNPHVCGAIIYCWSDDALCYNCYHPECPCETAWGLTYQDETPKPAYYVIKKYFTEK